MKQFKIIIKVANFTIIRHTVKLQMSEKRNYEKVAIIREEDTTEI